MDIDDLKTKSLWLQIIRTKPFLRKLYEEWDRDIAVYFPSDARKILMTGFACETGSVADVNKMRSCADLFRRRK